MKNYFYFSQGQKIGIVFLLAVIVLIIVANEALPYLFTNEEDKTGQANFMAEVATFKESLKNSPSSNSLFTFDPNTLDSAGFASLGLKPYVVQNILKYRAKGGRFYNSQDFSKIYGLPENEFRKLLPYISISQKTAISSTKKRAKGEPLININTCDTTALKTLKGIGSVFSARIIKYREALGGYVDKNQLKEVYGLREETYDEIEPFITITPHSIRKICINKATIKQLAAHPYLDYRAAKAICKRRDDLGKLTSEEALRELKELPEETLQKVLPYLSFD